jgi:excisionase family DNA binding protein
MTYIEAGDPWAVLTTAQVAEILKVSPATVRHLVGEGELSPLPGVRTFRFTAHTLNEYLKREK